MNIFVSFFLQKFFNIRQRKFPDYNENRKIIKKYQNEFWEIPMIFQNR
jgi:hypothetical protein